MRCGDTAIVPALLFAFVSAIFKNLLDPICMNIDHALEQTEALLLGRGQHIDQTPV